MPAPAARALARVAGAAAWAAGGREWSLSAGSVEDAVGVRYVDGRRARDLLGYVPRVGLAEGVRLACEVGWLFFFSSCWITAVFWRSCVSGWVC